MTVLAWDILALGDQTVWQDWCEAFMSENITMLRRWVDHRLVVTCRIAMDPYRPIDGTGSMPSLVDQAEAAGFQIAVTPITMEEMLG